MSRVYKYFIAAIFLIPILQTTAIGQVTVTGPACVIPGTVYQYVITGPWDSATTMQVCLTGGQLADSTAGTCTPNGQPLSFVMVTWNTSGSGSLQLQSSKGNSTIAVTISSPLSGGFMDTATKSQSVGYSAIPAAINCSPAVGGSCSPQYSYQWQQSFDNLTWSDIPGDTTQNSTFTQPATQTLFIRRKVTDVASNTIAFSDTAFVDVGAAPPTN